MQIELSDKQAAQIKADLRAADEQAGCAHLSVMSLEVIAHRGGHDIAPFRASIDDAERLLRGSKDAYNRLRGVLNSVGVLARAADLSRPSAVRGNELAALSTMGGADVCELLALLDRAQAVAERIDAARGYTVGDSIVLQPGESRGTDLAERLSLLALRVRREAEGGRSPHE